MNRTKRIGSLSAIILVMVLLVVIFYGVTTSSQVPSRTSDSSDTYTVDPNMRPPRGGGEVNLPNPFRLCYVSIQDGYIWTVSSRPYFGGNGNLVSKYNKTTNVLVGSVSSNRSWFEVFEAFVHDGVVYIGGGAIDIYGNLIGMIETFNETTMAEINYFTPGSGSAMLSIAVYDALYDRVLFSDLMANGSIGFWAVPPSGIANDSSYYFVHVDKNSYSSTSENSVITFNNTVYVLSKIDSKSNQKITRMYKSTDLQTWTLVWEKIGYIVGYDYFNLPSSSSQWIASGIIAGEPTNSTYRIMYSNGRIWSEYDTGLPSVIGEEHPRVTFLNESLLLFEYSQRFVGLPHKLYLFDCITRNFAFVGSLGMGYNDRLAMRGSNGLVYINNCESTNGLAGEIWTMNLTTMALDLWQTTMM